MLGFFNNIIIGLILRIVLYCFVIGNCLIFISRGFIDWKLCNIFLFICLNIFYVFDDVYKCKFCCLLSVL